MKRSEFKQSIREEIIDILEAVSKEDENKNLTSQNLKLEDPKEEDKKKDEGSSEKK